MAYKHAKMRHLSVYTPLVSEQTVGVVVLCCAIAHSKCLPRERSEQRASWANSLSALGTDYVITTIRRAADRSPLLDKAVHSAATLSSNDFLYLYLVKMQPSLKCGCWSLYAKAITSKAFD